MNQNPQRPSIYAFGSYELDVARLLLRHRREPLALGPKVVETLLALVECAGEVVSKDQLLERIWPEGYVEEANLAQNVYVLRKVLRAHPGSCRIETVPRRGYRLLADMKVVAGEPKAPSRHWVTRLPAAAAAVVMILSVAAASSRSQSIPYLPRLSAESARLYTLGRYYWNLRTPESLAKSVGYFSEVVKANRRSPIGYAALADAYSMIADYCMSMTCKRMDKEARAYARTALRVDPGSAEAHTSYAMTLELFDHRMTRSDNEFKRALALNPNYALAHEWYGTSLLLRGRKAEARQELEKAAALEPVATATSAWLGTEAYFDRRYTTAIRYLRQALDLNPNRMDSALLLGLSQEQVNAYSAAIDTFKHYASASRSKRSDAEIFLAGVYARMGRHQEALAALRDAGSRSRDVSPYDVALVYVGLGDRKHALSYMRRARVRSPEDRMWLTLDPRWDPVRNDSRFRRWISAS